MISAKELTKKYDGRAVVDRISFDVEKGQVVGFLGPNGAGKTTTMRLLTAYLPADGGVAAVMGKDVRSQSLEVRRAVGYLPENNPLYEDLELTDSLHYAALLRGMDDPASRLERIKEIIGLCGLRSHVGRRVHELSKGYRQRLGLAQAIVHDPPVLILDEPTSGLDPNQVSEVRGLIRELKKEKTLLLSTHILSEVTATCDRVVIIHSGKIVADGTPESLSGDLQDRNRLFVALKGPASEVSQALGRIQGVGDIRPIPANGSEPGFVIESSSGLDLREKVFEIASEKRWPILLMRQERLSLEEVFRKLTAGEDAKP